MIRWTAAAIEQLDTIYNTIALDNPTAAARQCRLIYEAVYRLERFPEAGRRSDSPYHRKLLALGTPYLIYYRIAKDVIFIRAIWHGARLPPRLR